ncbi:hypothetical protein VSP20_09205 [Myroides phaeus]|uniref:hypothetical protein n=1 Tax=Myroides phaeus TaxID=702745 RepID=UPI002DB70D19|nr:hypothetical protein [Myroides phaeus]MEC4117149.1 hypothetical protein [Myroides phaeus]
MFDNNNKVFAYKIALKLDPYLVALFNLCYDVYISINDIAVNNDEIKYATELFSLELYEQLDIDIDEYLEIDAETSNYISTKEHFFAILAVKLNSYYLQNDLFLQKLNNKDFLYYFKNKFSLYSTLSTKKEVENSLNNKLKSLNIISNVTDYLCNDKLKGAIKTISVIYDFNKNGQYIKVINQDSLKPQLLFIESALIDFNLLDQVDVDINDIWINYEHGLTKKLNFNNDEDEYFLLIDKNTEDRKVVGIKVNDHILVKYNTDFKDYIIKENFNKFLWLLLKESFLKKRPQGFLYSSDLISDFKQKSREPNFNKLLCNLQNNLYINRNIAIEERYQSFFEKFIVVKNLKELTNYNFFLPDEDDEKELLGIYTETKIGKKYNLLHYLKHKDLNHTEAYVNSEAQKKQNSHIKSRIIFLFS